MSPRREKLVLNSGLPIKFLLLSEFVLNFMRVTDMLDLGEGMLLDTVDSPSAVYL